MEETLKITKEDALKAHENANSKGKKLLEDLFCKKIFLKDVTKRIKTLSDVFKELGENDIDVIEYRKLQKANVSDYILANQETILICKALNECWQPDWNNYNERKYFPWFDMGSSGFRCFGYDDWHSVTAVGSRLCFKSPELAKYAGIQFKDIYAKYMIIK